MYVVVRICDVVTGRGTSETLIEWLCLDEALQRWYLSTEKYRRWEFDLLVDAQNVIDDHFDGDAFLRAVPIAERPLYFPSKYPSVELPIVS